MWVKKVASTLFNETHELVCPSQFFKVLTVLIIEKLPKKRSNSKFIYKCNPDETFNKSKVISSFFA